MARGLSGTTTTTEVIAGVEWLNADPYLWRHLAEHAAEGQTLDALVKDVGFLAVADPERLLPALAKLTSPDSQKIAGLYRRAGGRLYNAGHIERMALLHLIAHQEAPDLAQEMEPLLTPSWQCRWARWDKSSPHLWLTGHEGGVTAVALANVDGRSVVISGGKDRTVRMWDARTGRRQGEPIEGEVRVLAVGEVDGEPVIVAAGTDGFRAWNARNGPTSLLAHSHRPSIAVALGMIDGEPVIVSSGGEDVRVWNIRSSRPRRVVMADQEEVVSLAFGDIEGEPVIISGNRDRSVRAWDARTGKRRTLGHRHDQPSSTDVYKPISVVLGELDGEPVIISGGGQAVRVWDARTVKSRGKPFVVDYGALVTTVAAGLIAGEPMIAAGYTNGEVRLSEMRTGRPRGAPIIGHQGGVTSVALGEVDGNTVVVSGDMGGAIRVWDASAAGGQGDPGTGHLGEVRAVAIGTIDGEPIVASDAETGALQLWEARTGRPSGRQLRRASKVQSVSVTLGAIGEKPVIVSVSFDGRVRIWDARTGSRRLRGFRVGEWRSVAIAELNGALAIVAAETSKVQVWDVERRRRWGKPIPVSSGWPNPLAAGNISGDPVAVLGGVDVLEAVDLRSGEVRHRWRHGHDDGVGSLALGTIDGEPVIVSGGSYDGTIRVWQAESGRRRSSPLIGHRFVGRDFSSVSCLALGKVGGLAVIASGGADQHIHVWDPQGARRLATLQPGGAVNDLALGSCGELVIAGGAGLLVVDLVSPEPLDKASGSERPDRRETWAQTLAHLRRSEPI